MKLKFIKTFEGFSDIKVDEGENFYEIIGSNLTNLIKDQKNAISKHYRANTNNRIINSITKAGVGLTSNEIVNFLKADLKQRVSRIRKAKNTSTIKKEFEAYFYFIHFLLVNLRINIQQLLAENPDAADLKRGSESFKVFDLGDIENLSKNIELLWDKLLQTSKAVGKNSKNLQLIQEATTLFLNNHHQRWTDFFKNENWEKYQIKELPEAQVDEQQKENEGLIFKEEQKIAVEPVTKAIDTVTKITKTAPVVAKTAAVGLAITPQYKTRFNQKGGTGKGSNNMQNWFLDMFLKAEKNYGKNFNINSGYRSKQYQDELRKRPGIKAAKNSPHVQGVAADISTRGINKKKAIDALTSAGFNRLGIGRSFIHVDAGDRVNPKIWVPYARWGYKY